MIDGARNALLGYLYQLSLVASLRADAAGLVGHESGWLTLLGRVARGTITSEMFNQDAVVTSRSDSLEECAAVQIKYSGAASEPIHLQAFIEILHRFDQSRKLAADDGWIIDRYFVITNRCLDSQVESLWNNPSESALHQALDTRRIANSVRPDWLKKMFKPYTDETSAIRDWSTVHRQLQTTLAASYQTGFNRLKDFARRHGVLTPELDSALSTLFGRLLQETTGTKPLLITTEWLKQYLVGAPDALDATFEAADGVLAASRQLLHKRLAETAGPTHAALVRRRLAQELRASVERYPVTFVIGSGGSGKSVLAIQHLLAFGNGPIGLSLHAAVVTGQFLNSSLTRLRSRDYHHELPPDTLERAVSRLKTANPDKSIVLTVEFDALDEAAITAHGELRRLIRLWLDEDEQRFGAKLLVTCRPRRRNRAGHLGLLSEWVGAEYPEALTDRIGIVEVADFDLNELADAAQRLGGDQEVRLLRASSLATLEYARTLGEDVDTSDAAQSAITESLRHPVVWGAYASLEPQERGSVLDGLPGGLDRLAHQVLCRFLRKCRVRRDNLCSEEHLEAALRGVAKASLESRPPHGRIALWEAACGNVLSRDERAFLYGESLSYGLIQEDEPSAWRWRHGFVAEWLNRGGNER
jgi:hypothetical protein